VRDGRDSDRRGDIILRRSGRRAPAENLTSDRTSRSRELGIAQLAEPAERYRAPVRQPASTAVHVVPAAYA
jgi:hypothetical protein